ncbi:MAG: tRNA (adenosine(37)-N6)-threonylcarbamoyltransferase complex ATPase subunit type 1 TsaE [Pseudomonadota bacterium]
MNTNRSITVDLPTLTATEDLARMYACLAEIGDVITLQGDLGTGKTTFARAFIQAWMQKSCQVPSPTFTLVQLYERKEQTLYHFDLYRLDSVLEVIELGLEEALHTGLTLIEWPERLEGMALSNHLKLEFSFLSTQQSRKVVLTPDTKWQERVILK